MLDDTSLIAREAFLAFADDPETRSVLAEFAGAKGWSAERVVEGGIEEALAGLADIPTPETLVVDVSSAGDPLVAITQLAEVCDPGTKVITIGTTNDVELYRTLLEMGVGDYLVKPVRTDRLLASIDRLEAPALESKAHLPNDVEPGRVIGVVGCHGGVGTSTIVVSAAWIMAHEFKQQVALVDLDLHFGTAALALDLEPGRGLGEALQAPDRIDSLFIERAAVRESENLAVLAAEEPMTRKISSLVPAYEVLFERLRAGFERTIVDIPRTLVASEPEILSMADTWVIVTEFSLVGLRDALQITQAIADRAPEATIVSVINRAGADKKMEVRRADFEKGLSRKIDHVVPLDMKAARAAAIKNKTIVAVAKKSPAVAAIRALAEQVSEPPIAEKTGWFTRKRKSATKEKGA